MGLAVSKADAGDGAATAPPPLPNFSFASQAAAVANEIKKAAEVDYLNLPQVRWVANLRGILLPMHRTQQHAASSNGATATGVCLQPLCAQQRHRLCVSNATPLP